MEGGFIVVVSGGTVICIIYLFLIGWWCQWIHDVNMLEICLRGFKVIFISHSYFINYLLQDNWDDDDIDDEFTMQLRAELEKN